MKIKYINNGEVTQVFESYEELISYLNGTDNFSQIIVEKEKIIPETRLLKGAYKIVYRVWKIEFPYMTCKYFYGGTEENAKNFAIKIKKDKKFIYDAEITEIDK